MSNISPEKIIALVADNYKISLKALSAANEARCVAVYLINRHTQTTLAEVIRLLGLTKGGATRAHLDRQMQYIAGLLINDRDIQHRIEAIELIIDAVHEINSPLLPSKRTVLKAISPPRPVYTGDMTHEWYRANDEVFRRAILLAAE